MKPQVGKDEAIAEITRRLIEFYHPLRIYLFGSEARGDAGPDSDLDFLVVVPDDISPERLHSGSVYSFVSGTGYAKDIVPWRKTDFEARAAHVVASLPAAVVREGKILYDAGDPSSLLHGPSPISTSSANPPSPYPDPSLIIGP